MHCHVSQPTEVDGEGNKTNILTQVLSILITAPLGAISIVFLGPRLLEKQEQNPQLQEVEPKPKVVGEVHQLQPPPPSYAETKELP